MAEDRRQIYREYPCGASASGGLLPLPEHCPIHGELCDTPEGWFKQLRTARDELRLVRGAMAAQDEREAQAGARCDMPRERYGCDWPDWMAEALLSARAAQQRAEQERDRLKQAVLTHATSNREWTLDEVVTLARAHAEDSQIVDRQDVAERQLATLREALEQIVAIDLRCDECSASHTVLNIAKAALRAAPQGETR